MSAVTAATVGLAPFLADGFFALTPTPTPIPTAAYKPYELDLASHMGGQELKTALMGSRWFHDSVHTLQELAGRRRAGDLYPFARPQPFIELLDEPGCRTVRMKSSTNASRNRRDP